eukprot:3961846-Lingulodinium_polyedra.AAC.1
MRSAPEYARHRAGDFFDPSLTNIIHETIDSKSGEMAPPPFLQPINASPAQKAAPAKPIGATAPLSLKGTSY